MNAAHASNASQASHLSPLAHGSPTARSVSVVPFYIVFSLHAAILLGYWLGGAWNFLTAGIVFVLVPALDLVGGRDHHNHSAEEYDVLEARWSFRVITLLYAVFQLAVTIFGAWAIGTQSLLWYEVLGLVVSIGTVNGNGINFSHELLHKPTKLERFWAQIMLMVVGYMHFMIEHTVGHHVHIATPSDPASARRGESFYRFYPRTVVGSFRSAWRLERKRLSKHGIPLVHWRNKMLWYVALPLAFGAALTVAFGWQALAFFAAQSVFAFSLLELVNYIEHYGLARKELAPGRYESVKPRHSWEARETFTNILLIKLQRHADHHVNPLRRYQALRVFDESPQLPTGYLGSMLLALVPPLFFRVVHPIIDQHEHTLLQAQEQVTAQAAARVTGQE
jgi:alkane 1-monooxygenase